MSGTTTTVLTLAGGMFFIALLLPIFFDVEFPTGKGLDLADKALCIINMPQTSSNATCTVTDDIFDFLSGNSNLVINATGPKEITFTVNGTGSINDCVNLGSGEAVCSGPVLDDLEFKSFIGGTDITITADASTLTFDVVAGAGGGENNTGFSLGGDTDVFKNKAGVVLNFRGLTGGTGVTLTENPNFIEINATLNLEDLDNVPVTCNLDEVIKYNSTSAQWECRFDDKGVDFAILQAGSGILQIPAASAPTRNTIAGTNYDYLVLEYDDNPAQSESALFTWSAPLEFDPDENLDLRVIFETKVSGGGVCFDIGILGVTSAADWDQPFTTTLGGCETSLATVGELNLLDINFTSAQHQIQGGDLIVALITRDTADASDTNTDDADFVGTVARWSVKGE